MAGYGYEVASIGSQREIGHGGTARVFGVVKERHATPADVGASAAVWSDLLRKQAAGIREALDAGRLGGRDAEGWEAAARRDAQTLASYAQSYGDDIRSFPRAATRRIMDDFIQRCYRMAGMATTTTGGKRAAVATTTTGGKRAAVATTTARTAAQRAADERARRIDAQFIADELAYWQNRAAVALREHRYADYNRAWSMVLSLEAGA